MSGRLARNWLQTFAISSLTIGCGAATGILAARLLMPEGRGVLEILRFWPGMLWSLGMLGLGEAVAHRIARAQRDPASIVASSLVLALGLAAATGLAAFLLLPYLLGAARREWLPLAQTYGCTVILLTSITAALRGVDQGELRFVRYNSIPLISTSVYLCALVIAAVLDIVSVTVALWALWSGICVAAVSIVLCRIRDLRAWPSFLELKSLCGLYATFHGANLIFLIGGSVDRAVLTSFWPDAAIGLYAVALTVASTGLAAITISFRTVLFPHLSTDTDLRTRHALFARGLRYACLLLIVGTAALGSVTPWLVPTLFGRDFAAAVPTTLALLIAQSLLAVRNIIAQGLRGLRMTRPGAISEVISIAVFLACIWPLTSLANLPGIGLALVISNLVSLAYLARFLSRRLDLPVSEWWGFNISTFVEVMQLVQRYASSAFGAYGRWVNPLRDRTGKEP